ncbi:MAG: GNAT family N-acetyltransferase [Ruminococcus sp.]|jgi:ribosomal protein S18 acetylase RimI-like enzyme
MSELRKIPNVGKQTEKDLLEMGYTTIKSLRGKRAEDLYEEECRLRGVILDRCQLYLYRAVEYYVNTENPDPQKCKWWFWKDDFAEPSPCGARCAECSRFPGECAGCRKIAGRVYWAQYMNWERCAVYDCCVNGKGYDNCGKCEEVPCRRFVKDPTISDEENEAGLRRMMENLKIKIINMSGEYIEERFEFRNILPQEGEQAAKIEQACFSPNEACTEIMMKERAETAPELFFVGIDRKTGKMAGFLNGLSTDECKFRDEFFKDAGLHNPKGENIMLLGLAVLPEYQGQGLARELMHRYLCREREGGRKMIILTCLESKIGMYEKMGFQNHGISKSSWGDEVWYDMVCMLKE